MVCINEKRNALHEMVGVVWLVINKRMRNNAFVPIPSVLKLETVALERFPREENK